MRPEYTPEFVAWFWSRVDQSNPAGCWPWKGRTTRAGYGTFSRQGKEFYAHRTAYELARGPLADGMNACHDCPDGDNPRCARPDHLFEGTQGDNIRDMWRKGRGSYGHEPGELNGFAKLTDEKVRAIRAKYAAGGISQMRLADEFGVDQTTISLVILRRRWAHVE